LSFQQQKRTRRNLPGDNGGENIELMPSICLLYLPLNGIGASYNSRDGVRHYFSVVGGRSEWKDFVELQSRSLSIILEGYSCDIE
jgi:hypothetical protein